MIRVASEMSNSLLELALPRTDAGVYAQTIVMGLFWTILIGVVVITKARREYRTFTIGLAVINFAWFAARTVH